MIRLEPSWTPATSTGTRCSCGDVWEGTSGPLPCALHPSGGPRVAFTSNPLSDADVERIANRVVQKLREKE